MLPKRRMPRLMPGRGPVDQLNLMRMGAGENRGSDLREDGKGRSSGTLTTRRVAASCVLCCASSGLSGEAGGIWGLWSPAGSHAMRHAPVIDGVATPVFLPVPNTLVANYNHQSYLLVFQEAQWPWLPRPSQIDASQQLPYRCCLPSDFREGFEFASYCR